MAKSDPREFLLNTDYEMDKIIFFKELDRTVSAATTVTIAHKLPTVPLVFGIWADNKNFTNAHELGAYEDPWNPSMRCRAYANLTNVYLELTPRMSSGSYVSTHFYIKLFGFEPKSNHEVPGWTEPKLINKQLPKTFGHAKDFIINTDYNYLKLLKGGSPLTWDSARSCMAYKHNLGYVPQTLLWWSFGWSDDNGDIQFEPLDSFSYDDDGNNYKSGYFVDGTELLYYSGMVPLKSEVRLYADEA